MNQKLLKIFILGSSLILFLGCKKVVTESPPPGQLEKITLETLDNIPLEYGKLMAVTTHAQYEGWSQLWFVDDSSTIRMVRVQFHFNRIHENVLVIPRQ
jgi:hypothetical protein